jgi:hypothetical protein
LWRSGLWEGSRESARIALIAALVMLASSAAQAHRISTRSGPPPAGVSIPSLTHGQMALIRDNLPAIRALASARLGFDLTTWRLEDYLNLQSFACLWGIVPGSITDEESRSTNAPMLISPPGGRSSCSSPMSPAPITNRLMR